MATYSYRGINRSGQGVRGQVEAETAASATAVLAGQGVYVDEIKAAVGTVAVAEAPRLGRERLRLSEKDRVVFVRQFGTALQAQLPLVTALQTVAQQNPSPRVAQLASGLAERVRAGESLSAAFGQYPRVFDRLYVSMVEVGENTGALDRSMVQLAELAERELEARANVTTAALYPAFVLALGLISVAIVVTWILPRVLTTLATDVIELPWPTRVLMLVAGFLRSGQGWALLGGLAAAMIVLSQWKKTATGRYAWDAVTLRLPILGPVKQKWAVARFARTLGTLSEGGVGILAALRIVRDGLGSEVLAREMDAVARQVRAGVPLTKALGETGRFPPLLIQIIHMGEQTGRMAELLGQAAASFERESQRAIGQFMALFPAVLILVLAVVIGFIVAATLLPILQIETAIPGL